MDNDVCEVKGLYVHDSERKYKWTKEAVADSVGKCICLSWHVLPKNSGVVEFLRKVVESGQPFYIFYLKSNVARHRATVVDFSVREDYEAKKAKWQQINPERFEDKFWDYKCKVKSKKEFVPAAIVFLASRFEEITDENNQYGRDQFVIFTGENRNPRDSRMKAYTGINSKTGMV